MWMTRKLRQLEIAQGFDAKSGKGQSMDPGKLHQLNFSAFTKLV